MHSIGVQSELDGRFWCFDMGSVSIELERFVTRTIFRSFVAGQYDSFPDVLCEMETVLLRLS